MKREKIEVLVLAISPAFLLAISCAGASKFARFWGQGNDVVEARPPSEVCSANSFHGGHQCQDGEPMWEMFIVKQGRTSAFLARTRSASNVVDGKSPIGIFADGNVLFSTRAYRQCAGRRRACMMWRPRLITLDGACPYSTRAKKWSCGARS